MKRIARLIVMLLVAAPCALAQSAPPAQRTAPTQKSSPAPRADDSFGKTQLFQVVILTATVDGPEELKGLPKNAEKAISDIRNFLPYKSYHLLDSALLRAASHADRAETQLQGTLDGSSVDFRVAMNYREREGRLMVDHFQLVRLNIPGSRRDTGSTKVVLESSLGLVRGETVVVGTSKLGGEGRALIVLVTAIPTS